MKERPILFSGPMVRAILEGKKTQTRRVVKPQPTMDQDTDFVPMYKGDDLNVSQCPYGQQGDRLWVRETWAVGTGPGDDTPLAPENCAIIYKASWDVEVTGVSLSGAWRPSIHMPRWASRITLGITGVSVERLQDISRDDAIAEGVDWKSCPKYQSAESFTAQRQAAKIGMSCFPALTIDYIGGYKKLWESINGPGSWDANPWVWVIEFKRVEV